MTDYITYELCIHCVCLGTMLISHLSSFPHPSLTTRLNPGSPNTMATNTRLIEVFVVVSCAHTFFIGA